MVLATIRTTVRRRWSRAFLQSLFNSREELPELLNIICSPTIVGKLAEYGRLQIKNSISRTVLAISLAYNRMSLP